MTPDTPQLPVPYVPGPASSPPVDPTLVPPVSTGRAAMVRIAELGVDDTTVYTPYGPLVRSTVRWRVGPNLPVSRSCPWWVIVLSVLLAPCTGLLSLLGLLIRDVDRWGQTLTVSDGRISYSTMLYNRGPEELADIQRIIAWAQQPPGGYWGPAQAPPYGP